MRCSPILENAEDLRDTHLMFLLGTNCLDVCLIAYSGELSKAAVNDDRRRDDTMHIGMGWDVLCAGHRCG
jgi:hypothetical protein